MAKVVFLGTPEFGVPVLKALARHHQVVAVVTQPDRRVGRGRRKFSVSAVKQAAMELRLEVLQPASLGRDREAVAALHRTDADLFVIASFGQILRPEVLEIPRRGCIGVHGSLLPKLRGAAPIPWAILNGDEETGITLMLTDAGMDTGPIIAQRRTPILPTDTAQSLSERLSRLGADLLIETLPSWLEGEIEPQPQDDSQATYAPRIVRSDGAIDWGRSAREIERMIRAFTPWPGVSSAFAGSVLKVLRAHPLPYQREGAMPGTVVEVGGEIGVVTGEGLLILERVQLAGKRAMDAEEFARGRRDFIGSVLG